MDKCVVLFAESDVVIGVYKRLVQYTEKYKTDRIQVPEVIYQNVRGMGGYEIEVIRKFKTDILPMIKGKEIVIVLCRDTEDVSYVKKSYISPKELKEELKHIGASKVISINAKKSIEDWLLYDIKHIKSVLGIEDDVKVSGENGYEKMKNLFKSVNRVYMRASKIDEIIQNIDIEVIIKHISKEVQPFYRELGVNMI